MKETRMRSSAFQDLGHKAILLCGMAALGLLAYFAATTVYSSDDYWYSTFWDNGPGNYLTLLDYHYREFNGRTLVHMLAHLILHFDNWAFVLVCCGLCLAAVWTACCGAGVERKRIAAASCFFLIGILMMPTSFFAQGVMWISAFCNYVFPVVLVCILIMILERKRKSLWLFAAAFLCGATTEQMGLASVAVCAIYSIDALVRREEPIRCLAAVGFAGAGALTIFLSPATRNRAASNMHLEGLELILTDVKHAIQAEAELLTENPVPMILMLAFFVLAGWSLWRHSGRKWMLPICGCGAAALVAGWAGTGAVRIWGFVISFFALAALAIALIAARERCAGALMLAALASAAVMLPTNTIFSRVMVPFYVLMLLSVCILGAKAYINVRSVSAACLIGMALAIICLIPAIRGYWYNYQVDQTNKAYAAEDRGAEELRYCVDYDLEFTLMKPHEDQYFRLKYLESIGMPEDTKIRFVSSQDKDRPRIFCEEELLLSNAISDADGRVLMPLREIVEHFGGTVGWTPECTTVDYAGVQYRLSDETGDAICISWTDQDGQSYSRTVACGSLYGNKYCEMTFFSEIMGLSIQFEEAQFCYVITA